jgi:hypothetical protein
MGEYAGEEESDELLLSRCFESELSRNVTDVTSFRPENMECGDGEVMEGYLHVESVDRPK